jgi:dephospho-CoA kinase
MHKLFFVIGASGSGKTTVIKSLESSNFSEYKMLYFDSIGVPSYAEMLATYKSPEEWQRIKTVEWVKSIKEEILGVQHAILDGQTRPQFIEEACVKNGIDNYAIILFDCSDEERTKRLKKRGQPELATQQMMEWANYLREKCQNTYIIENTHLNEEETLLSLIKILKGSSALERKVFDC